MRLSTFACCVALVSVALPGFVACNDAGTQESQSGTVSLPLTTMSRFGTTYRLTNATFSVTGGTLTSAVSLSSATDPTVTSLSSELSTGSYSMALQPGWQMVSVDAAGATTVVNAILVSASTQAFAVAEQTVTEVSYLFNVNGIIVSTGTGTVQVNVSVNDVGPGAYGNGMINGYVSSEVSANSTISPADFSAITSNGPFCVAGTLGASYEDYAAVRLSLYVSQSGFIGSLALGNRTAAYNISGTVNSGQMARINLVGADGTRWCANVPVGTGSLATSAFATSCWSTGGAAYAGEPVTAFEVVAVGMTTAQSYNFCLNSLAFN